MNRWLAVIAYIAAFFSTAEDCAAVESLGDLLVIPPYLKINSKDSNYQKIRKSARLSFAPDSKSQFGLWCFLVFDREQNGRHHTNSMVEAALKEHPNSAVLHFYLAKDAQDTLDDDKAIDELSKAIKCNPRFFTAYNERENLYRQSGQWDAGLRDISTMMALQPMAKAHFAGERAKFYLRLKKYAEAHKDAHLYLSVMPDNMPVRMLAIEALMKMGDWKAALKESEESEKYGPDHQHDLDKAQILIELKRTNDALQFLNKCIAAEDSSRRTVHNPFELSNLLRMRAQLYKQLGKTALADADNQRLKREFYDQTMFREK